MRRLFLICVLALSACGKAEEPPLPSAPPDAAINLRQPIDAHGTIPPWGLKIRGLQFTVDRPDKAQVVATAPGAVIQPGKVSWTAVTADGHSLKVDLYSSLCSDGVSDVQYSYSAEVILPDGTLLAGCASAPAAAPARSQARR